MLIERHREIKTAEKRIKKVTFQKCYFQLLIKRTGKQNEGA